MTTTENTKFDYTQRLEKELLELHLKNKKELAERIQAERNLWESQRKFKTLLSNLPGMAYRCQCDPKRTMEFLSKGSHELTGYHSWELLQNNKTSFTSLIADEDINNCWLQIQNAVTNKTPYQVTYRINTPHEGIRWVQDQGQAIHSSDDKEIIALEGFIIDITETKNAQNSLQKLNEDLESRVEDRTSALRLAIEQLTNEINEKRHIESQLRINESNLRNAQRIASLGSWHNDLVKQTYVYSDEIYRILGITPNDALPNEDIWTPHIHPDDLTRVLDERLDKPQQDNQCEIEYRIILHNNDQRFFQERSQVTYNENQEPINIATTVLDITDSKRTQEELISYREHLQELVDAQTKDLIETRDAALAAERAMSAFIANMSHEIRTPLHGILSFANFGLKKIDKASKEKLEDYFQEIHDSGETLLYILNDLLDLSKLKAGKMVYDYTNTDLSKIIHLAVKEFNAMRDEKCISLKIDAPSELNFKADKDKLRQVLRNIISNAIKFSPEKTSIEIQLNENNENILLAIKDQGPGIPDNEIQDIFSPFIQSSKTRSKAGGTGLGLAICKEIIESGHQGSIEAQNNNDVGTTFVITLPKQYAT